MSVVYPVARGVAPTIVLLAGIVVLGYGTSWAQAAGVVLVGLGVLAIRGVRGECRRRRLRAGDRGSDRLVHARRQARARLRDPDRVPRGLDDRARRPVRGLGRSNARRHRGAAQRAQSLLGRRRNRDLLGLRARARRARARVGGVGRRRARDERRDRDAPRCRRAEGARDAGPPDGAILVACGVAPSQPVDEGQPTPPLIAPTSRSFGARR